MDAAAPAAAKGKDGGHGKRVSFTGMFRYADRTDLLLMLVGTLAALGNGVSQPLMTVIFGDLIDAFGGATSGNVLHRVNKAVLSFVYLGIGTAVVSFLRKSMSRLCQLLHMCLHDHCTSCVVAVGNSEQPRLARS